MLHVYHNTCHDKHSFHVCTYTRSGQACATGSRDWLHFSSIHEPGLELGFVTTSHIWRTHVADVSTDGSALRSIRENQLLCRHVLGDECDWSSAHNGWSIDLDIQIVQLSVKSRQSMCLRVDRMIVALPDPSRNPWWLRAWEAKGCRRKPDAALSRTCIPMSIRENKLENSTTACRIVRFVMWRVSFSHLLSKISGFECIRNAYQDTAHRHNLQCPNQDHDQATQALY